MTQVLLPQSLSRSGVTERQGLRLALAAVGLLLCYGAVVVSLVDKWSNHPLYSYGFAVPLISAYMIWTTKDDLRTVPLSPDYMVGAPLILLGLAMLTVGHVGALTTIPQLSLVVTLTGLVLVCFGRQMYRRMWFPLIYLLLMVPIWDQPISRLQIPSQLLSARIAVEILRTVGVPAGLEGTLIHLPKVTLQVLRECSGVNQLIVVFAMALPAAYLFLRGLGRRIALVCIAVVVAYLSNGFRIALIGFMAQHDMKEAADAHGPLHMIQGLIVSGLGYCLIGACVSLLASRRGLNPDRAIQVGPPAKPLPRREWAENAVVLLILLTGAYQLLFRPIDVPLQYSLQALPSQLEGWTLEPNQPVADLRFAGVDDEMRRSYRNTSGDRVSLYVGYHRHQASGKELNGDASRGLTQDAETFTLHLPSGTVALKQTNRANGPTTGGALFWYDVNGRMVDSIYLVKAYTVWDALTRRRTNGAVVVILWDEAAGARSDASREKAAGFVRAVLPFLRGALPS